MKSKVNKNKTYGNVNSLSQLIIQRKTFDLVALSSLLAAKAKPEKSKLKE